MQQPRCRHSTPATRVNKSSTPTADAAVLKGASVTAPGPQLTRTHIICTRAWTTDRQTRLISLSGRWRNIYQIVERVNYVAALMRQLDFLLTLFRERTRGPFLMTSSAAGVLKRGGVLNFSFDLVQKEELLLAIYIKISGFNVYDWRFRILKLNKFRIGILFLPKIRARKRVEFHSLKFILNFLIIFYYLFSGFQIMHSNFFFSTVQSEIFIEVADFL